MVNTFDPVPGSGFRSPRSLQRLIATLGFSCVDHSLFNFQATVFPVFLYLYSLAYQGP